MEHLEKIIILANGSFPQASRSIKLLHDADIVVCCDAAADNLLNYGREPDVIIGDMDSVSGATMEKYADRIIRIEEQENNDLTKAVNWCVSQGYKQVLILGATGKREDHTLGNISLLLEYNTRIRATMVTDYGEFCVIESGRKIDSFPGEKISIFSTDANLEVSSSGLKYPLDSLRLHNWWRASLNEVTGKEFMLSFESKTPLILFRGIRE